MAYISRLTVFAVVFIGVLYQFLVKNILMDIVGYGRNVKSIKEFPHFKCEKIDDIGIESCEDMWLDHKTGYLYMACSDTKARTQWLPSGGHLNASGRGLRDRIGILDTRGRRPIRETLRWLSSPNYVGTNGDRAMTLQGIDIRRDEDSDILQILLINHRPPIDPITGEPLDATIYGANSTVEHFETRAGHSEMRHVRTIIDPLIKTPNDIVWIDKDSFVVTNDHNAKVGLMRALELFTGGGSVVYCNRQSCNIAWSSGVGANGITRDPDGLIYVAFPPLGRVGVYSLEKDHTLQTIENIKTLPIDNLSVDSNGDVFAAALPQIWKLFRSAKAPLDIHPGSTVLRISRLGKASTEGDKEAPLQAVAGKFNVETVVEDDGSVLPGSTVVVHDTETGRLFLAGPFSAFMTMCEPRTD